MQLFHVCVLIGGGNAKTAARGFHGTSLLALPCRSFEIQYSYDRQTATDTVHAVAALLETPPQGHEDTPIERFWWAWSPKER